jgi:hypothetical protein
MRFCIEDPLIQAHKIKLAKDKIEVLECFTHPETFHAILVLDILEVSHDILDCRIAIVGLGVPVHTLEHLAGDILVLRIPGNRISLSTHSIASGRRRYLASPIVVVLII